MARSSTTFGPGNTAALKHGARSQKTGADTSSERVRDGARQAYPWLPDHPELETRYVTTTAQIAHLRAFIEEHGSLDTRGKPRPAVTLLRNREKDLASCLKLIESFRPRPTRVPDWRISQARLRIGLHGVTDASDEDVRLVGGEFEARKLYDHKRHVSAVYQNRRRGELLDAEETKLFLENEEQLRLARQGV